jgi:hypothetical protein
MAGTTVSTHGAVGASGSTLRELVKQLNAAIANLDTITAAMDLDGGITGTTYGAMVTASKIGDASGTAITA